MGRTSQSLRLSPNGQKQRIEAPHLAVPMYVVILAFVGGAVSLSRRIPEYQKRSDPAFRGTEQQTSLAAVDAREVVVFQIMQLLSAPFIAMSAYYIVGPSTLATAVGLAFACGFASEPILLMIRGIITGIRPEGSRIQTSERHAIQGTVASADGVAVAGAAIAVAELPMFSANTDVTGHYVVPDLSDGVYRVSARTKTESGQRSVTVCEAGAANGDISMAAIAASAPPA